MGAVLSDGQSVLTAINRDFSLGEITSMHIDQSTVTDNTVTATFAEGKATVTIADNIAPYVSATVEGAHVKLNQSADVSDTTYGEITYILSGEASDGSFCLDGSYKATIELQGLALTNPTGAALDIENGKRIALSIKKDTENALADGTGGIQKGALFCKGHLELKGKGVLNVTGNTAHAIASKEYVEMKNCTVNILGAVKDGINCAQYFKLESGELNISGTGDDAIQVDFKDAENREAEDTATATIAGGKLTANVTAAAAKCLKTEGDIIISGGEISMLVSGPGTYDTKKLKTKAASCLSADANVTIDNGTINLRATGSGGKGISCDGILTINGGEITVNTSGGIFAYVNGNEYDGYTGNTDNLASDAKSSPKGMKADTEVIINGGIELI